MAKDSSLYARRAIIARLKSEPTVTVLVPAARIYPGERPAKPAWPFIAYGRATVEGFSASCLDGSTVSVALHAYAETTGEGDETAPGEDSAHAVAHVLATVLDGETLDLASTQCPWPAVAHVSWVRSEIVPDNEDASAWHAVVFFTFTIAS